MTTIPYKPEPFTDFSQKHESEAFAKAIDYTKSTLGAEIPVVIGGERYYCERKILSINPSDKSVVVGNVSQANKMMAEQAMQVAYEQFKHWSRMTVQFRAEVLFKAAAIMRRQKHQFSALLTIEAGKVRAEADADTAEAIDFLEYYARQMIRLSQHTNDTLVSIQGESNHLAYIPLGVGLVISPWNFPLAITVGMTAASIVAGNTVVLKPASTTPVIAYKLYQILEEAGLPAGVLNFLPGSGADIGDYLVTHRLTRYIAFTGSKEVGLRIHELSAKVSIGQTWLKRFIGEMGGKDSIVVDRDADLELASQEIVASAFGFSGQKCSACSRAIIHKDVYKQVLDRCVNLTKALKIGDATDVMHFTGPVIDQHAFNKIMNYIQIGKQEGQLMVGGASLLDDIGYYIEPTIIADVSPDATIMQEEIFGPVLAFTAANDFDHALQIANHTIYGLTGSLFSRNRVHIERARTEFHVGNLYFNRKCTGAIVGVHPFGGFHMSGTNSKAGGPDYLLQFTQLKLTSEKL